MFDCKTGAIGVRCFAAGGFAFCSCFASVRPRISRRADAPVSGAQCVCVALSLGKRARKSPVSG
jgi:hypothetical protein